MRSEWLLAPAAILCRACGLELASMESHENLALPALLVFFTGASLFERAL